MHALGNLNDQYFTQQLKQHGVEVYEAATPLLRTVRAQEINTAVVSSSNNCAAVLDGMTSAAFLLTVSQCPPTI